MTRRRARSLSRRSRDQPVADSFRHSLRPIADAEPGARVQDIVVNGPLREAERLADLSGGFAARDAGQALELAGSQRRRNRSTISQMRLHRAACQVDPRRSFPASSSPQPACAGFDCSTRRSSWLEILAEPAGAHGRGQPGVYASRQRAATTTAPFRHIWPTAFR